MKGLFNDLWKDKDVISVDHCLDTTFPVYFLGHLIVILFFLSSPRAPQIALFGIGIAGMRMYPPFYFPF